MTKTIDIITLGCSKNLVDSERLMYQLKELGYKCVHDSDNPKGEIAIVNTCGFIGDAKEESINTILQLAKRKKHGKLKKLYVMGCLAERYRKDLEQELPEVDAFYGKFDYDGIVQEIREIREIREINNSPYSSNVAFPSYSRVLTTPSHYAYLKIAEGCNRHCSYCAIPLITGNYKSRTIDDIVDETRWLAQKGVKEVQLMAQDLTYYGKDIYGNYQIAELVERMSDVKGIDWIRLHYAYPTHFPMDMLRVIRERDNVCNYLDIALQHSSDHMLALMRRHISAAEQRNLIHTIREEVPDIYLRTTLMVGHPQETDEDFADLLDFTREMHFERMGAFAYSHEEGTYAYKHYDDNIPEETKQRRLDQLMALQEDIAAETSQREVGKTIKAIVDRKEGDYYIARTEHDSPEIDPEILIEAKTELQIGEFYTVKITSADTFDLYGETIIDN